MSPADADMNETGRAEYVEIALITWATDRRGRKVESSATVVGHKCQSCGSLVSDVTIHDRWHATRESAARPTWCDVHDCRISECVEHGPHSPESAVPPVVSS